MLDWRSNESSSWNSFNAMYFLSWFSFSLLGSANIISCRCSCHLLNAVVVYVVFKKKKMLLQKSESILENKTLTAKVEF